MNSMSSLEAAAEAAAKVNAMLIAKGKLKPPPSAVSKCKGSNVKSAGDLFTSEVEINDAPLSARNLLTRGHTQDEINKYSGAAVSTRGRYMTFEEKAKNTGERPLYLYVQASEKHAVDLGVHRIHEIIQQHMQNEQPQAQQQMQQQQQQQVVVAAQQQQQQQPQVPVTAQHAQQNPPPPRRSTKFHKFVPRGANGVQQPQGSRPPPLMSIQTSMPSVEKVFVGLDHAGPAFDLRNKVVGSGGTNLLYIRNETGAIVTLRGKCSGYIEPSSGVESPEPMYLCIEHPKFEGLQSAKQLAQNLVETLQQEFAQWQQQQQQQINTLAMQNSVLHPTQFQAMGVGMGQPGVVTVHQPLQQQDLLQSGIQGMVATSVALPVVSNMPTLLAGQLQQASQQLAGLHQQQQQVQQQPMHHQQVVQQHQMGTLPPHIQTGPPPPPPHPHALLSQHHHQHHHQQHQQQPHHQQQQTPPPQQQQGPPTIGLQQQHHHHLQIHQQATGGVPQQGVAFPPQLHQAILSPLQAMAPQPQQGGQQPMHHAPPPPQQHPQQLASITQMAQQTVQGTLLVSPGQMVFTQAPVSSPQHHHQVTSQQQPGGHQPGHQQPAQGGGGGPPPPPPPQQAAQAAGSGQQQPLAHTPPPPPLPPPPSNQQPPSGHLQQHLPTFQQMYIPQQQAPQQQMAQQQPGVSAMGMAMPPMAMTMHPPPMGPHHPQPVPMPTLSGQPQMNSGVSVQHGFMSIPSNQTLQLNNSVPVGAYPYQQLTPVGAAAGGMSSTGSGSLPAISYPIFRQEQRPPPVSSEQQAVGQQQQLIGKTSAHKRRLFLEDANHPDQESFQLSGMPVMSAMGQPPPPPPSHSPNSHHQPPPRQGNGLQEMMVGGSASGPPNSTLAPPPLGSGGHQQLHHQQLQHQHQQQHQQHQQHQQQPQQQHLQQHQQQDRDKQLMPPPPPPLPSGEKRPAVSSEPDVKRHKGALSSVSGYGSDEEDQGSGPGGTEDSQQQRQQQSQQSQQSQGGGSGAANGSTPFSAASGVGPPPAYAPPKTTFSHYSSKPQMYGHASGSSSTSSTASSQAVTSSQQPQSTQAAQQQQPSPPNAAAAFQALSPACQQPPPGMHHPHHQQHQAPPQMFGGAPPPPQGVTLGAGGQPALPPPPSYQQQQQGMAFAGYQYNSSLPFWMVQQ